MALYTLAVFLYSDVAIFSILKICGIGLCGIGGYFVVVSTNHHRPVWKHTCFNDVLISSLVVAWVDPLQGEGEVSLDYVCHG